MNVQVSSLAAPVSQEGLYRPMWNTCVGCKRGPRVPETVPSDIPQTELLAERSNHFGIELVPITGLPAVFV